MKQTKTKVPNLKILSRVLALLVFGAMISGCANTSTGGGVSNTDAPASVQETQKSDDKTEDDQEDTKAKPENENTSGSRTWQDLWDTRPAEGTYNEECLGPMAEPITLKVVGSYGSGSADVVGGGVTLENSMWVDMIRDFLNIEFDYMWIVPSDQWDQRFQLSISAGEIPDLVRMNEKQFRTFIETNSLRDMTEAYDKYAIPELQAMDDSVNGATRKQATVDGELLAIPRYEDNHASVNLLWYRNDWAEKYNLDAPETIQDVMDMAVEFANQNEVPDIGGLSVFNKVLDEAYSLGSFFQSFDAYPQKWIVKDGEVVPGIIQSEMLTALKAAKELYDRGGIPKDFAALSSDQASEKIINSSIGITFGKWWAPDWPLANNLQYDPEADWVKTPLPGISAGQPAVSSIEENMVHFYNGVYVGAPDHAEEALVRLINFYFVDLFPASEATWPQQPVPAVVTEEERLLKVELDEERRLLGKVWDWSPVLTWNSAENINNSIIENEALKNGGETDFQTATQKSNYDNSVLWLDWLESPTDDPEFYQYWRIYASRTMDDSGVLMTARVRDEGHVIDNVFYGGATETEEQVSSTLLTMAQEYFTKFILGEVSDDSWEGFVDEWLSLGGQDWWDEVVEGYDKVH